MAKIVYNFLGQRYTESGQRNPIRYVCLRKLDDGSYVNTTQEFKCKDYFNDFVINHHGCHLGVFTIYGMDSDQGHFNLDGSMDVLMYNLTEHFEQNIKNVIDPVFGELWGTKITVTRIEPTDISGMACKNPAIVTFSRECFVSTFTISALMLFLRNCNMDYIIQDYDARLDRDLVNEGSWSKPVYEMFKSRALNFPERTEYYWFAGESHNSDNPGDVMNYVLHDNGVLSWAEKILNMNVYYKHYDWLETIPKGKYSTEEEEDEDYVEEEEYNEV